MKNVRAVRKLEGIGPVDNRPSNDKLHHFVQKNVTCDTFGGVNILSKFKLPSSYRL